MRARASPSYWIVNLSERRFEVYTGPSGPVEQPGYPRRQDYATSDEVPLVIEGLEVSRLVARELLP